MNFQKEKNPGYDQLIPEIEMGKIKELYLFCGEENYLKEDALEKIVSFLIPLGLKSFNLDILRAREINVEKIINTVSTFPFGAEKRVVIVYEIDKLSTDDKENFLRFLSNSYKSFKKPLSHCCLILVTDKQDFRLKFYKELKNLTAIYEFKKLWDNQIPNWIERKINTYKKKFEPEGIEILLETAGSSLPALDNEIKKLVTYVGENNIIRKEDVEVVVGASKINNVFQLSESVGEKDLKRSLSILNNLILYGEKPGGIIFWLTEHFIRLLKIKTLNGNHSKISAILKTDSQKIISKYLKQLKNFDDEQLEEALLEIYKADVELKSSPLPNKIILELLVYNLCHL